VVDPGPIGGTTASGLTKRVPGSTLSDMPELHRGTPDSAPAHRPADVAPEDAAGAVYNMLSDFWSGVERGVQDHRTGAHYGLTRRTTNDADTEEG
jgi:hypothetical protein